MNYEITSHDSVGFWITILAASMFVSGLVALIIAKAQRRGQLYWFLSCFLFPPFLILLVMLSWGERRRRRVEREERTRRRGNGGLGSMLWRRRRA
jgi:hypothetical protein